jgi:hypothetical protein
MKRSIELRKASHRTNAASASVVVAIAGATELVNAFSNSGIGSLPMLFRKARVPAAVAAAHVEIHRGCLGNIRGRFLDLPPAHEAFAESRTAAAFPWSGCRTVVFVMRDFNPGQRHGL